MSFTAFEEEKLRRVIESYDNKEELSETEVIKSLEVEIEGLQGGLIYPIPKSGNTPTDEPAPTENGIYTVTELNATYVNFGNTVVPNTTGIEYKIQVSGIDVSPVYTLLENDLNIVLEAAPILGSTEAVTSDGIKKDLNKISNGLFNVDLGVGYFLKTNGNFVNDTATRHTVLNVLEGVKISTDFEPWSGLFLDFDGNFISGFDNEIPVTPTNATILIVNYDATRVANLPNVLKFSQFINEKDLNETITVVNNRFNPFTFINSNAKDLNSWAFRDTSNRINNLVEFYEDGTLDIISIPANIPNGQKFILLVNVEELKALESNVTGLRINPNSQAVFPGINLSDDKKIYMVVNTSVGITSLLVNIKKDLGVTQPSNGTKIGEFSTSFMGFIEWTQEREDFWTNVVENYNGGSAYELIDLIARFTPDTTQIEQDITTNSNNILSLEADKTEKGNYEGTTEALKISLESSISSQETILDLKAEKGNYVGNLETLKDDLDNKVFEALETVLTISDLPTVTVADNGKTIKVANIGNYYVSNGVWVEDENLFFEKDAYQSKTKTLANASTSSTQDRDVKFDLSKEICSIELPTDAIREHSFAKDPSTNTWYMLGDVLPLSNPDFPDTYNTEIGLWKSTDLVDWTYLGIAITKGGVGELAEYGVASCSGFTYFNGKFYAPFSARNTATFTNRSIGLAYTSTPEVLPWNKVSTAIVDVIGGEDDDPSCVSIPEDENLHVYFRTRLANGDYKIAHSKSKTPETANSWLPINDATSVVTGLAQELTSAFYADGCVQLYIIEQGTYKGTSHLFSNDSDGLFELSNTSDRFLKNIDASYLNGHIGVIIENNKRVGYTWTVTKGVITNNVETQKYGVIGYKSFDDESLIAEKISEKVLKPEPSFIFDGTNYITIPNNTQNNIEVNEEFTFLWKGKLDSDRVLDTSADQNCVFSLGDPQQVGSVFLNLRGSSTYKGCFFRIRTGTGSSDFIDIIPLVDVSHYFLGGKLATIEIVRESDGNMILFINGKLIVNSSSDTLIALQLADYKIGSLQEGVIPFYGEMFEFALLNERLTNQEIAKYKTEGIPSRLNYVENTGVNTGILLHLFFDAFSDRFIDRGFSQQVAVVSNYALSQHKNISQIYKPTIPNDSVATTIPGLVVDFNNLLAILRG